MRKLPYFASVLMLAACNTPPKTVIPYLTPETANQLLHYSTRAQNWLTVIQKRDPSCVYQLILPDQSAHPNAIDLDHIVFCGNRPSPREFDATVSFEYDPDTKQWVIKRFAS